MIATITLSSDNGIKVITTKSTVEYTAKKILGWRTPTKRYNTIFERFMSLGSSDYNKVIETIYKGETI